MSQIIAMAKRLQEAEATIVELQKALQEAGELKPPPSPAPHHQAPAAVAAHPASGSRLPLPRTNYSLGNPGSKLSRGSTTKELLSDLSLDANGKVPCRRIQNVLALYADSFLRYATMDRHRRCTIQVRSMAGHQISRALTRTTPRSTFVRY